MNYEREIRTLIVKVEDLETSKAKIMARLCKLEQGDSNKRSRKRSNA